MTTAATRRTIPLALIDAGDRLRPADPAFVAIVAASFEDNGQLEAIEVRPNPAAPERFLLTLGLHRLEAAQQLGWKEIDAEVRERDANEARLAEIDENLMRRELGPLDRAIFLAARKRVWEAMYPATAHGKAPKSLANIGQNKVANLATHRFSKEVEERTGLSERTVRRATALVANLSPAVIARIRGTYLETHGADLEALASLGAEEQLAAAEQIASGAVRRLGDLRPRDKLPADEAQLKALLEAWSRASAKTRRRFAKEIGYAPATAAQLRVVAQDLDEVG